MYKREALIADPISAFGLGAPPANMIILVKIGFLNTKYVIINCVNFLNCNS